jgi:hypothetical protein
MTSVGNNGSIMSLKMRFCNLGKERQILVGCPTLVHNVYGGGMCGGEGRLGSFLFHVPRWLVVFPLV